MGWWLCVAAVAALLLPPTTRAVARNILLLYESLDPNGFFWGDATVARADSREARALLAQLVAQTATQVRHTGRRQRQLTYTDFPDLEAKIPAEGWKNDGQAWNASLNERHSNNQSNLMAWNHTRDWKYPGQMNITGIQADKTDGPTSWNYNTQPWTKEDILRETKKEVYRRLLLRALQYHLQTHQQLLEALRNKGFQESILKRWLTFVTGPRVLHHILHDLAETRTLRHPNLNDGSSDVPQEEYTSRSDVPGQRNPKPGLENVMPLGRDSRLRSETRKQTLRTMRSSGTELKEDGGTQTSLPGEREGESSGRNKILSFLTKIVKNSRDSTSTLHTTRHRRSQSGLMYLPVGGTTQAQCPTAADAAGVSISQMAFLSICLTVFSIVVNINNNINNNNNNNNINSDNNLSNNNAQLSLNVNNAAQVNVMLPPPIPGRKRRSSLRDTWREALHNTTAHTLRLLQQLLEWEEEEKQRKGEISPEASGGGSGRLPSVTISRFADDRVLLPASHALGGRQHRQDITTPTPVKDRRGSRPQTNGTEATVAPSWVDGRVTDEGMGEVRGPCRGVAVTQNPQQYRDTSEELHQGVEARAGLRKDADVTRGSQEGAGVAVGLLRTIDLWLKDSPLASPACQGLQLCGSLVNQRLRPHPGVWLTVFASFAAYQRATGGALPLNQFVRAAVRGRGCRYLFPRCPRSLSI